jgi:hypothetical protein
MNVALITSDATARRAGSINAWRPISRSITAIIKIIKSDSIY